MIKVSLKLILLLAGSLACSPLLSQCTGGTAAGPLSPAPAAAFQTMSVTSGNYYTFVVPAGCIPTYDFSFCAADGGSASFDTQITILDNTGAYAGGYNDDNCGVQSKISGWVPPAAGTYRVLINTYYCGSGGTATLAYRAVNPPNMTFTSSTTTQASTAGVARCDLDQEVICVQVVTAGSCNPLSLSQFQINMTGSTIPGTNTNDVTGIHIYYTGTNPAYAPINEFLSGGFSPATGTITVNGSRTLQAGTNYFWIAYDINASTATIGNVIDAQCTRITINSVNYTPSVTNPAGTRSIIACPSYPGASSANIKMWLKSNAGVTTAGTSVTQWNDVSGAGVTGNFVVQPGAPAQTSPTFVSNAINNNPYVSFNGSNNSMASTNSVTGASLYSSNNNTFFMVHNLKNGIVYYKWETAGSGIYRVGFEKNANTARFDFVQDGPGMNASSTTNIANKDVIVCTTTDATNSTVRYNGNVDGITNITGAGAFSPGATTSRVAIGNNTINTNNLPAQIDFAEIISYNTKLAPAQIRMVESYLAIKYGITLGNNTGTGPCVVYKNSNGASIWFGQTGYHNNVTGIGRDDASGLDQRTSRGILSLNSTVDLVTVTTGTFAAPAAFSSNLSTLIFGNNNEIAQTVVGDPSFSNYPAALGANAARIKRVWKAQATNFTQSVSLGFESTMLVAWTPVSNLRLLVDDDGNFANGGTTIYSGAVLNGSRIEFSGIANLGNTGNLYFSLATINYLATPLPVTMLTYFGVCQNNFANIHWSTSSETDNDFFTIERSDDGLNFAVAAIIQGAGTTSQRNDYSWQDERSIAGLTYYRLSQTDHNGEKRVLGTFAMDVCHESTPAVLFPNPTDGVAWLVFSLEKESAFRAEVFDATGKLVLQLTEENSLQEGTYRLPVDLTSFSSGIYLLRTDIGSETTTHRIIRE